MLLLVFSCTEAIWYPNAPVVDTAAASTADSGSTDDTVPCSPSGTLPAATVQITNPDISPAVEVLWRDPLCDEWPYHTLFPGDSVSQPSYEGHIWVARDLKGALVDVLTTPAGSTSWEVTP